MIGSGTPSKNRMIERIRLSPDWLNFLGHREARPPTQDLARECRVQPRPHLRCFDISRPCFCVGVYGLTGGPMKKFFSLDVSARKGVWRTKVGVSFCFRARYGQDKTWMKNQKMLATASSVLARIPGTRLPLKRVVF